MNPGEKVSVEGRTSTYATGSEFHDKIYQHQKVLPKKLLIFHHWGCFTPNRPGVSLGGALSVAAMKQSPQRGHMHLHLQL